MGVHGLWDLLAPVGRRVSVETLAGKRLAIDASIWMIQFMKAMRDEKGEMVRNAHLLGFFRRICKLLYLRTKPVFIFDGGTPALKRRTVIARRRQREKAQAKIRKTAEKLLLNQLKQIKLKELAEELKKQRKSTDAKGKKVAANEADIAETTSGGTGLFSDSYNQEAVDEMLAASLAAEENDGLTAGESSSGVQIQDLDEDADEDEEMILPTMHGRVDPAILAALPPSMQLDLLIQMRERLMAENRQKYQRVKKVPARFSELQIQAYLKTVAFRRDIDEVQKSAAGRGIGGVQTSRIASEANREFIFSSNFNGDKQVLTSTGEGRKSSEQSQTPPGNLSAVNNVASKVKSGAAAGPTVDESQRNFENDVETYLDERGRVRVSRVRAMGIRMTRDLQRNLDLMKEIEEERVSMTGNEINECTDHVGVVDARGNTLNEIQIVETSDPNRTTYANQKKEEAVLNAGTCMEISFEDNGENETGGDDDGLFAHLVAGDPVMDFSADNSLSKQQMLDSASEPEWEEGVIEDEGSILSNKLESEPLLADGMSDEHELEWEEGSLDIRDKASSCPAEYRKIVSKGALEEEAQFQEAIRRSLQDMEDQRSVDTPDQGEKSGATPEVVTLVTGTGLYQENVDRTKPVSQSRSCNQQHESPCEVRESIKSPDTMVERNIMKTNIPLEVHLTPDLGDYSGKMEVLHEKACRSYPYSDLLIQDVSGNGTLHRDLLGLGTPLQEKNVSPIEGQLTYTSDTGYDVAADGLQNSCEATVDSHFNGTTHTKEASLKDSIKYSNAAQEFVEGEAHEYISTEGEEPFGKAASSDGRKEHIKITEARLEEEILLLDEEHKELGDEQKKLDRNAESVSSEMFAECQELLQIFGLPFIIAPMEAEAQCAYMELVNLVDGVVTDDSDTFLFGARSVYKNIFDDRKYVEMYFMKDIENELGLNREKLIRMALLLGSDYTEGVSGIGIVNAIEVVNAFPEEDGLHKFREWIESPDPSILGKFDLQAGVSARDADVSRSLDEAEKMKQTFMDKHRNVSKNWHIPSSFPSDAVISSYSYPQVDKSTEPFSWGKPDHFVLRKLCWDKFGWSTHKADELLLPVLKEYNKRETQLRLEAFYTFNERFAKIRSKRIKNAVKGIAGKKSLNLMDESVQDGPRSKKKSRVKLDDNAGDGSEKASAGQEYADAGNEANITEKVNEKKLRKTRTRKEHLLAGGSMNRSPTVEESFQSPSEGVIVRGRGRGRSRGRGGGRDHSIRKRRRNSSKYSVSSSNDDSNSESVQDLEVSSLKPHQVRRSERSRKEVNYTTCDLKSDDPDQDDQNSSDDNTVMKELSPDLLEVGYSAAVRSKISRSEHIGQQLSEDCLEKSGRFCLDKAIQDTGTIQLSSSQTVDFLSDTQLSKEYLTIGGGFCLGEDDTDMDLQASTSCLAKGTTFDSDPPNFSDLGEDENIARPTRTINPVEEADRIGNTDTDENADNNRSSVRSEVAILQENINEDDSGKGSSRSLRAMPNLRRKRRKI